MAHEQGGGGGADPWHVVVFSQPISAEATLLDMLSQLYRVRVGLRKGTAGVNRYEVKNGESCHGFPDV
ncbi:hypothetical protein D3C80_2224660 [compost metagenome]